MPPGAASRRRRNSRRRKRRPASTPCSSCRCVGMIYRAITGETAPPPMQIAASAVSAAHVRRAAGLLGSVLLNTAMELARLGPIRPARQCPPGMDVTGSEAGVRTVSPGRPDRHPAATRPWPPSLPDFLGGAAASASDGHAAPGDRRLRGRHRDRATADGGASHRGRLHPHSRPAMALLPRAGRHDAATKWKATGPPPPGCCACAGCCSARTAAPRPRTIVPTEPIGPADGWCDDPTDARYNRAVRLPYPGRHEELWRRDGVYDIVGVLGWNDAPVSRGHGVRHLPAHRPAGLQPHGGVHRPCRARSARPARRRASVPCGSGRLRFAAEPSTASSSR